MVRGENAPTCAANDARFNGAVAPAAPESVPSPPSVAAAAPNSPAYFSFKDFLSDAEAAQFFQLPHSVQVEKVTQYLDFLAKQPAAAHFTTSSKASTSFAAARSSRLELLSIERLKGTAGWNVNSESDEENHEQEESADANVDPNVLQELLAGKTRSGFGAFGTENGFLPQKQLSLAVAGIIEEIGHEYVVERAKTGEVRPPVLNSRSFFFYWCHAEKQKIMDIRRKLDGFGFNGRQSSQSTRPARRRRREYWHQLVVVVDRAMCLDCIQFATCFACNEQIYLAVEDPQVVRVFPPEAAQNVQLIPLS